MNLLTIRNLVRTMLQEDLEKIAEQTPRVGLSDKQRIEESALAISKMKNQEKLRSYVKDFKLPIKMRAAAISALDSSIEENQELINFYANPHNYKIHKYSPQGYAEHPIINAAISKSTDPNKLAHIMLDPTLVNFKFPETALNRLLSLKNVSSEFWRKIIERMPNETPYIYFKYKIQKQLGNKLTPSL